MFTIAAPFDPDTSGSAASTLLTGGALGHCTMDTFQVTGSGGASPVICGSNDGQHSEFTEYTQSFSFAAPGYGWGLRWVGGERSNYGISYLQAFFYFIIGHRYKLINHLDQPYPPNL